MRYNLLDPDQYLRQNRVRSSSYFQRFHIQPGAGLLNDPHGLIEFGGMYHLFYQSHPFAPGHEVKYWFHLTSVDLIHWEEAGFALKPEYWYEIDGCCSGSSIEKNGKLYLFYTGKILDHMREEPAEQYQAVAVSEDGNTFSKLARPLISPPAGNFSPHFRDPKVWKHGEDYYMIVAGRTTAGLPQMIGYRSSDLMEWSMLGILGGVNYNLGYMWECPSFARISGHDILFICPQGATFYNDPDKNHHQSGYLAGTMSYEDFSFQHEPYRPLDHGFEYYSSYVYTASDGRHLCFGWLGLPGNCDYPTCREGYVHCLSIPTELIWRENRLIRRPVHELDDLFASPINISKTGRTAAFKGAAYRLRCKLRDQADEKISFQLRSNGSGAHMILTLDPEAGNLALNRSGTETNAAACRTVPLSFQNGPELDIFVDISSIEVFVNGGEYVLSGRFFAAPDAECNTIDNAGQLRSLSAMICGCDGVVTPKL